MFVGSQFVSYLYCCIIQLRNLPFFARLVERLYFGMIGLPMCIDRYISSTLVKMLAPSVTLIRVFPMLLFMNKRGESGVGLGNPALSCC